MLLAVVVSVCSSVDAFLALGFAAQITPGALLAFLLLGPVVDLKLAGLFTVLMRPKDPDHGDRCQSWRAADRSVDQPVAAVRVQSF